jgi:hypothetical protein
MVLFQAASGTEVFAIYGFSNKIRYDQFQRKSLLLTTPYPLVARYLQRQIDLDDRSLRLIVLDATSPLQEVVYAATLQVVLNAINSKVETVEATHRLCLDSPTAAYQALPFFFLPDKQ